jgi:hypothetical protein
MLPIHNKFSKNKLNTTFNSLLNILNKPKQDQTNTSPPEISSTKTIIENKNENESNNKETQNIDSPKIIPSIEERIGYSINPIFESVLIPLDGILTCNGSITLDIGVWIITYGINFTTGSGDMNGANIYRIQYGISDNIENIPITNINDFSQLSVVTFIKPFYINGCVFVATNTETKTYYLLGSVLAKGESLVFGSNITATRIA